MSSCSCDINISRTFCMCQLRGDPYACAGYTSIIYAFAVQVTTVSTSDLLTVLQQQASVTQSTGVSAYTISL